jgi:kanamycin kinase
MQTSVDRLIVALLASRPGWNARPLGKSPYGIATYRLDGPTGDWLFLKTSPSSDRHLPLQGEYERTRWAADYLPVPKVVDHGVEAEFDWLMTVGIDAPDGTSPAPDRGSGCPRQDDGRWTAQVP